jgi:DNA-binding NarL/FixJ family response regulator
MAVTRALITDDHPVVRSGFRSLLEQDVWIEVVVEAMDGDQALCMAGELVPDVLLLLDVEMPLIKRIEVARELRD